MRNGLPAPRAAGFALVYQNVSFGLRTPQYIRSVDKPAHREQIEKLVFDKLKLVNLGFDVAGRMPPEISYGMQKRVSLARTLAPGPSYLLFDEPTTGLDPITTNAVNDLIFDLSRKLKVTSVVVSHDMACALKIADRILVLDQARILALGTPAEMKRSTEPLVRDFLAETLGASATGAENDDRIRARRFHGISQRTWAESRFSCGRCSARF